MIPPCLFLAVRFQRGSIRRRFEYRFGHCFRLRNVLFLAVFASIVWLTDGMGVDICKTTIPNFATIRTRQDFYALSSPLDDIREFSGTSGMVTTAFLLFPGVGASSVWNSDDGVEEDAVAMDALPEVSVFFIGLLRVAFVWFRLLP
jgi:hypothetical protein